MNELLASANTQKVNEKADLASFILDKGLKKVNELMETTWAMHKANDVILRSKKSRIPIAIEYLQKPCVDNYEGKWLKKAIKTLENNGVDVGSFKQAIKDLLVNGRSEHRNIIITGPANCGKTFILQLLSVIFKCFQNPGASAFARVGADEAEIIILRN